MIIRHARKGFTLIELLVVITILGILAALLFPVFVKARENGRRTACQSNERQLGLALFQYVADNDERFPSGGWHGGFIGDKWVSQCFPYFKSATLLLCPDDMTKGWLPSYPPGSPGYPGSSLPMRYPDSYGINLNLLGWAVASRAAPALSGLAAPARTTLLFEVENDAAATTPEAEGSDALTGSAAGNGGEDCGGSGSEKSLTYPCGTAGNDPSNPVPLFVTGDIGGRALNGGTGSRPRHADGANYLACDGHVKWLRPENVSGGRNAVAEECGQGTEKEQPADCRAQGPEGAAGTGDVRYSLTFSNK